MKHQRVQEALVQVQQPFQLDRVSNFIDLSSFLVCTETIELFYNFV